MTALDAVFPGIELQALAPAQRDALNQAAADFRVVAAGGVPRYALIDAEAPVPADGGTCYYQGQGYRLTVLRGLCTLGAQTTVVYGPILQLDETLFAPPLPPVSDVRLYAHDALRRLQQAARQA
ncbi:hypothetical protein QSH18_16395 [Xanthomonas sp. NCPPB 2654]|uniref:hypothetical protein n=1 Tax=unclassified Xanthomonas TaxID=2643310 RepID=UPI0021E01269|nr:MULTISPECIES: hypothetical protein [unclassified Xanthomonas]MDL5367191.1 hypothetical protein [Xanthomonas sp. NCPPB 2654]UYC22600.1 hypothetical protein NUG20_10130 [Xanthomonas sp. CFBP 8443]